MINLKGPITADEVHVSVIDWETIEFKEGLTNVIALFATNAGLHCVFVVDPYDRLLGVITRHDLLHWIRKKLVTISYHSLSNAGKFIRLRNLINSTKAREVMNPKACRLAIKSSDRYFDELNLMTEFELTVLPVVDESNRVIGARTLSEILLPIIS